MPGSPPRDHAEHADEAERRGDIDGKDDRSAPYMGNGKRQRVGNQQRIEQRDLLGKGGKLGLNQFRIVARGLEDPSSLQFKISDQTAHDALLDQRLSSELTRDPLTLA